MPSSTLHHATDDNVGADGVQPSAICHGEDDTDLDKAVGVQRGAISMVPSSRYVDDLDEVADVQRGAVSTTSDGIILDEVAGAQRGTLSTFCEARRRRPC
jgi:hypothetical protein